FTPEPRGRHWYAARLAEQRRVGTRQSSCRLRGRRSWPGDRRLRAGDPTRTGGRRGNRHLRPDRPDGPLRLVLAGDPIMTVVRAISGTLAGLLTVLVLSGVVFEYR